MPLGVLGVAFKLQGLAALLPAHPPASLAACRVYLPSCLPAHLSLQASLCGWCDMV